MSMIRRLVFAVAAISALGALSLACAPPPALPSAPASTTVSTPPSAPASTPPGPPPAGVGQYSAPLWFPLRRAADGTQVKNGCTYLSPYAPENICNDLTTGARSYHTWWALDLMVKHGSPVYAAGAGCASNKTGQPGYSGYGSVVVVDHGAFGQTLYAHLSSVSIPSNCWVGPNNSIGLSGDSGASGVYHLHFEKINQGGRFGRGGSSVDPGLLYACHGGTLIKYPEAWGASTWQGMHWGKYSGYSDGTTCSSQSRRLAFSRSDGAFFRIEPGAWEQMAGPGASSVAVDGQAMAMIVPWQGAIYRLNDSSPWVTIRDMTSHPSSVAVADNGRLAFTADDGASFRACNSCAWQQMAGPGASKVAVDKGGMAMIVPWQGAIYRDNDSSPWVTITDPSSGPTSVAIAR
jgi:hypothetical protein